ncbi:hypothetical protein SPI_01817 [Niveomyces insectorum RCEF 264]|uniref:DUF2293 domain-containing protein n=1 Tax=Niveomyces insectorum RCEF 264 TaxID=1081102 RepID=A0A167Z9E8_9HYPO|nr:hypothetical protein SPI_01817 [Niveomyces insectorum RCEF 264]
MGREKKHAGRVVGPGGHAKERHKKTLRSKTWGFPTLPPTVLNARPVVPNLKSKHHSYYELVENKDKKKKLEFKTIVEQAREAIGDSDDSREGRVAPGLPEPIPETQEEINEQADKAIRDLFPRIPNTDRQLIIEHSFKKGASKKGEPLVGLARGITLSRRVQLAVLAHIRHTHTRYDQLLRETSYANARKAVESLCLDILVKWRGDEETGRDQLDEILREVIVISDTESEDEDAEEEDGRDDGGSEDGENETSVGESGDSAEETTRRVMSYSPPPAVTPVPEPTVAPQPTPAVRANTPAYAVRVGKARRGFKRRLAAAAAAAAGATTTATNAVPHGESLAWRNRDGP